MLGPTPAASHNVRLRPYPRMLSRRAFSILAIGAASLLILFFTSDRLTGWSPSLDQPYFHLPGGRPPEPRPPTPHYDEDDDGAYHDRPPRPPASAHDSDPGSPLAPASSNETDAPPRAHSDPLCADFPDTSGILVSMKTGASESFDRLPTQFMTMLRCLPDFLLFSDMEQHMTGYHVYDALDTVLAEARDNNPDFDLYRRQRSCPVDQDSCNKLGDPASEGWNLDKYKNIHMAEKAYAMRPDYDWYVFVDADTYVLWPNLVQWLRQLKPTDKHYIGSVTMINDKPFAHGGSGYVLSKATMESFVGAHPNIGNKYDVQAKSECCGDYLLSIGLKEMADIEVEQAWPTINGEKPHTLPFGSTHWCQPIVTMHHMNSEEISTFWDFERRHFWTLASQSPAALAARRPLLLRDIYAEFLAPKLVRAREDWDNLADDVYYFDADSPEREWESWRLGRLRKQDGMSAAEKKAHLGFSECRAACESVGPDACMSFKWSDGLCGFGRAFQLGKPTKREDEQQKRTMSGWPVAKIEKWIAEQGECTSIEWPYVKK